MALLDKPIHLAPIGGFVLIAADFVLITNRELVGELARFWPWAVAIHGRTVI